MRRIVAVIALGVTLIGLGASVASLVDYLGASPTFCTEGGCATVRLSAWAHPLGIPMPIFGIAFFAAMTVLAFVSRPGLRLVLAIGGGLWALGLIALQAFVLDAWCKLCMIADPAAIVLAALVLARAGTVRFTFARGVIALPFAALPLAFLVLAMRPHAEPPIAGMGTPAVIAREQVPGKVTIVEFVDFECPFCRKLAPKLQAAIEHAPAPVRVVRKMVPLAQHPHARDAALAWCCADAQGRGDEMAAALFAAAPDTLTPDGCEQLALQVGCDRERYRATLADPTLATRLATDLADAKAAGVRGFPTVFIGDQRISGANHEPADLVAAIGRADGRAR